MKILKPILNYLIWTAVALLIGIGYVYIVLGQSFKGFKPEEATGFWRFLDIFHEIVAVHVGLGIGVAIALLFILADILYLRKKLKNNFKSTIIRFLTMLVITFLIAITLYIL